MINRTASICLSLLLIGSAAFAHSGVKNAAVKARMDAMSGIGASVEILGKMAKGEAAFDQTTARAAAAAIAGHAAETPDLFRAQEDDPKSEAKAEIWSNFADFEQKSKELEEIATALSTGISSPDDLGPALKALGANCQACHKAYRE